MTSIKTMTIKPIKGDDLPIKTISFADIIDNEDYSNVYTFTGLSFDENLPLQYAMRDELTSIANEFYRDWELNNITLVNFKRDLQLDYDMNKYKFEKVLESVNLIVRDLGQRTTRTLNRTGNETHNRSSSSESAESTESESNSQGTNGNTNVKSGTTTDIVDGQKSISNTENESFSKSGSSSQHDNESGNGTEINYPLAFTQSDSNDGDNKKTNVSDLEKFSQSVGQETSNNNKSTTSTESADEDRTITISERVTDNGSESESVTGSSSASRNEQGEESIDIEKSDTENELISIDRFVGENSLDYANEIRRKYPNILDIWVNIFIDNFTLSESLW